MSDPRIDRSDPVQAAAEDRYLASKFLVGQPVYGDHRVLLHRSLTTAVVITPDANGNVVVNEEAGEEIVDIIDTHLYCDTCGVLGYDELADHGIAELWEEV